VVPNHLQGFDPQDKAGRNFTIGVYPMLPDETCWFSAADFDKASWQEDAGAFLETCLLLNVPAALERSRSGNGEHIWMFFAEPVPAALARTMGTFLLSQTMERRQEIWLDSYDRFSPARTHSQEADLAICLLYHCKKSHARTITASSSIRISFRMKINELSLPLSGT